MFRTPTTRRILVTASFAAAAFLTAFAGCGPKHAVAPPPGSDNDSGSATATTPEPRELAAVCAEAEPIAAVHRHAASSPTAMVPEQGPHASGFAAVADVRHKMADLQALARAHQYAELYEHLEDIPPASRTAAWESLLREVANAYMTNAGASTDGFEAFGEFARAEGMLRRYPVLANDTAFMAGRAGLGANIFQQCFGLSWSGEECVRVAKDFVAVAGTDASTKLAIAKLVRKNQFPYFAIPFFRSAVAASRDACGDDDLALSVEAALGLPPDDDNAASARSMAQEPCFEQLRAGIEGRLRVESGASYFTRNACAVLRAKGVVRP